MNKLILSVVAAAVLVAACAPASDAGRTLGAAPSAPLAHPASSRPLPSGRSSATPHRDERLASFRGSISTIDLATRARMESSSWRPGCPVPIDDLRLVTATYWGFDGAPHQGELVVNRDVAPAVEAVVHRLFDVRFPIRRIEPVEAFAGSDDRSMAADNTSGFNCRPVEGHPNVWSEHAYGRALDINPLENPYVRGEMVLPPAGAAFVDRNRSAPGMIHVGDAVVRAFAAEGWGWGGSWHSLKDYQHFSSTGR